MPPGAPRLFQEPGCTDFRVDATAPVSSLTVPEFRVQLVEGRLVAHMVGREHTITTPDGVARARAVQRTDLSVASSLALFTTNCAF